MAQTVKTCNKTWVQALGWEDPLEKGMDTHSSILAWRIPWTEEPGGLQSMGSKESASRLNMKKGALYVKRTVFFQPKPFFSGNSLLVFNLKLNKETKKTGNTVFKAQTYIGKLSYE